MEIGISTGLFYKHDIVAMLPIIKRNGFNIVEIWDGGKEWGADTHFDHNNQKQVNLLKERLAECKINPSSLHGPFGKLVDISSPDSTVRKKGIAEIVKSINTGAFLGAKTIVLHPGGNLEDLRDKKELDLRLKNTVKSLEEILPIAQENKIKISLENLLTGMVGGNFEELAQVISNFPQDLSGICLDISHAALENELDIYLKKLAQRIIAIHVSDNGGILDDHMVPGEGILNWTEIVNKLKDISYQGIFMLEVLGEAKNRQPDEVLSTSYKNAVSILQKNL